MAYDRLKLLIHKPCSAFLKIPPNTDIISMWCQKNTLSNQKDKPLMNFVFCFPALSHRKNPSISHSIS